MQLQEIRLSGETKFSGRIFSVSVDRALLPDGRETGREVVHHPGGVCILAMEGEEVLMVRQYRYAFETTMLELPAGRLEADETPEQNGRRELREETGYEADHFAPFGVVYSSPGILTERIYLFVATGLRFVGQDLDPGEFLRVERMPLRQAVQMALAGDLPDAKTQVALLRYAITQNIV